MSELTNLLLSVRDFLAGQLTLFISSYFYLWVLLILLEKVLPYEKRDVFSKHHLHEILFGLFIAIFLWPFDWVLDIEATSTYVGFSAIGELPLYLQSIIGVFFLDLSQYLRHRLMHSRFFWVFHTTHHSAVELRFTTHFRVHPVEFFVDRGFTIVMLFLLGLNIESLGLVMTIAIVNNMWLHANIDLDYGHPLRYLFSSPNYHKWHHSTEREAQNKNYADLFPILDIIGGTYYYPKDRKPTDFGVRGESKGSKLHQTFLGPFVFPFIKTFKKS